MNNSHIFSPQNTLLTRKEAAQILRMKEQTLAVWASTGRYDLKFIKNGRKVFYTLSAINEFLSKNTHSHTI